jgi:hypothetical protein
MSGTAPKRPVSATGIFYPPQGWQRLLPKGMRVPAKAYDDLVALILVERYCRGRDTAEPT